MLRMVAAFVMVCALAIPASAQPRGGHGWGGGHGPGPGHSWYRPWHRQPDNGALGGFLGGLLGGYIWGQATRPGREGGDVEGSLEPWSPLWYKYCTERYRTFDPKSGKYFGFDGEFHFCEG